ncbi:DNA topoisomerase III [Pelotomaculum terephthalicicum JT]|uniref:DNA topoisomerase III n=1 Tax=Pelotomaculum terephthalicicum TaxID=206393 RepID=UPI0009D36DFE|nr:DNA topoisomerase III [Pelotomaculum terephthalicicum]MCG9968179.1 DNA topoisomerase III [Pelotomaculum terephthalicicum JT]OPY63198.1 MAG: DNA topoisomerase 3 [Pelotomaculum sp. PtaU1.Bin065]
MREIKTIIIAEKPSVARDLAAVIGQFNKKDGYLENNEYIVTWAIGHLVTLAEPEDYDSRLKKWRLDALPIVPEKFLLKPIQKTVKQLKIINNLVKRQDVGLLINACDAGREGELIFRYIYHFINCKKPFKRLWLSETTTDAVKRAFAQLRPGAELDLLAQSAQARSRADWLIGLNATRAFTVRHNNLLSVGRVQTPTLALIVNREQEILKFTPVPYWELYAVFTKADSQSYTGKWFQGKRDRFDSPDAARQIQEKVAGKPACVAKVEQKEASEPPPLLFNLNDLQKEANKKYGLPAAGTLEIAQALYEKRKLITYPRTESRHITKSLAGTLGKRFAAVATVEEYAAFAEKASKAGAPGKRYVDDGRVTDHTALLPTETKPDMRALSPDERKIYDLVARRFLAIFFPSARYRQTRVVTETEGEKFLTTGRVELEPGWKAVYAPASPDRYGQGEEKEHDENTPVPELTRGEAVLTDGAQIREKKTKPPKRYTEATLLSTMEGAGRLLEDNELKEAMKGHGLGTPATRAAIIERLINVGYIARKQKTLYPTEKGTSLVRIAPEIIKSPEMTGRWEKALADIEDGRVEPGEFMTGIIDFTRKVVDLTREQEPLVNKDNRGREALGECPLCSSDVLEFPKSYSCSGYQAGCKFAIWKEIAGKKISITQARKLLQKKKTGEIKGFKSKTGKEFAASLILGRDGKVNFEFQNKTK